MLFLKQQKLPTLFTPGFATRRIAFFLIAYFAGIFVFALIYWQTWQLNPEYFIVASEFNLSPIQDLRDLWLYDRVRSDSNSNSTLDEFYLISEEKRQKYATLMAEINQLTAEYESQKENTDKALEQNKKTMWANFDEYLEAGVAHIKKRKIELQEEIDSLNSIIEQSATPEYLSELSLRIAELRLEIAQLNLKEAEIQAKLYDEVFSDPKKFQNPELSVLADAAYDRLLEIEQKRSEANSELATLRGEIYDTFVSVRSSRISKVDFIDFLYFSSAISTTTTFGDILPNHKVVRLIVIMQLFLNIVLVGVLLAFITNLFVRSEYRS